MIRLIEMIEAAKTKYKGDNSEFFKIVPEIKPFVFKMGTEPTMHIEELEGEPELDLPFPIISIEMDVGYLTIDEDRNTRADIICVVVEEVTPTKYKYYLYMDAAIAGGLIVVPMHNDLNAALIKKFMDRLRKEEVGNVKSNGRVKYKHDGDKILHKIKDFILVAPKKFSKGYTERYGNKISYSHSFWVRGHWRIFDGIGKDRSGDRGVKGFTWITHHIKGNGPLVEKSRIYKE